VNWVLGIGVVCLGTSLFLTWHNRRQARRQVLETLALYQKHSRVVDADPPAEIEGEEHG
jgi:hypothetical protein